MWKRIAYQLLIGLFLASILTYAIEQKWPVLIVVHLLTALSLMMIELIISPKERWASGLMMSFNASLILLMITQSCYYTLLILLTGISLGYIGEYIRQHVSTTPKQRLIMLVIYVVMLLVDFILLKETGVEHREFDFSIKVIYPFLVALGLLAFEGLRLSIKGHSQKH